MKLNMLLATTALAMMLSACTATPDMIEAQKDHCTQVGYAPGTPEHAACTGAVNATIWRSVF